MKKLFFTLSVFMLIALFPIMSYADAYDRQGWIKNGGGSIDTFSQKIYEWDQFNGGCYCFHGAGSTAINIRMGKKSTDTKSTHAYFLNELNAYQYKDECETSSQDWLNASNRYHISDLNIYKKPSSGYFGSTEELWNEIKNNVNNNRPMLVPLTHYGPRYASYGYTEVSGYENLIGHAVIIVGYIDFYSKIVAIRDPAVKHSDVKSNYKYLFDYTLSLETLDDYLQSRQMLVFNTKTNADLKSMALINDAQPGDSCGNDKVYDCVMKCVSASTAQQWIGDNYCDNGEWGMVLTCPAFNNDGGDCD